MKILSIVSQKGGVGKTTVALNLAFALARRGKNVWLIDSDPQGAVGLSLAKENDQPGLADMVFHDVPAAECIVHTRLPTLSLLPVGKLEPQYVHALAAHLYDGEQFRRVLGTVATAIGRQFDLAIIDTPSGFTGITIGALRASDFALSPLQAEPVAARSLTQLFELLGGLRAEGARVELVGIVLSMLQLRNNDSLAVAQDVWDQLPEESVCRTTIPRDPAFLSASRAGVPVGLLSRRPPPVAAVFDQLAQELEGPIFSDDHNDDGEDDGPIALLG